MAIIFLVSSPCFASHLCLHRHAKNVAFLDTSLESIPLPLTVDDDASVAGRHL